MKILITGATGFIGRNLVVRMISDGHDVHVLLRRDSNRAVLPEGVIVHTISDTQSDFAELFTHNNFDGLVHLATLFTASHTPNDIYPLIEANVVFGTKLIDAATKSDLNWFINTGTFSQYAGEDGDIPANLYSATKQAFADIVKFYASAYDTKIITLELFNTFGAGDTRKKIFNIWDDLSKSGGSIDMSPGEQIIDISHINNVIDGYCHAIEMLDKNNDKSLNGKIFTLPSQDRMTLRELATFFAGVTGRTLQINFGAQPYRTLEIMNPQYGTPLPGWNPRISLREGIKRAFVK